MDEVIRMLFPIPIITQIEKVVQSQVRSEELASQIFHAHQFCLLRLAGRKARRG
jgi:hypothetical protein